MKRILATTILTLTAATVQAGDTSICRLCGDGEVCAYISASDTYYCKTVSGAVRGSGKGVTLSPTNRLRALGSQ